MIDFDRTKAVEIVTEFHRLGLDVKGVIDMCRDEITEADKSMGDLRHYVELNYPLSEEQSGRVITLLNEACQTRRRAKDILEVLTPLSEYLDTHKNIMYDLSSVKGKMVKAEQKVSGERTYRPRVLVELFEEMADSEGRQYD